VILLNIKEIWEKRAKEEHPYDVVYGKFQGRRLKKLLETKEAQKQARKRVEETVMELGVSGKKVIDAGIGPLARFSIVFCEFGADVIGIDISKDVLESAKSALNGKQVNLILADIMNLPFKEETFDISFCVGTIYHMPNGQKGVEKALKELARVTKKSGFIYFNVENYLNPINWPQIVGRGILKALGATLPPHTLFNYYSLLKIVERSGLRIIDIKVTFELWGPLIFLPWPILKNIRKIWIPISEKMCKISEKNRFFRFMGVGWYLRVMK